MPTNIEYDLVKKYFDYNPYSGILTHKERSPDMFCSGKYSKQRKCRTWNIQYAGKPAGSNSGSGYLCTRINNIPYKVHRIAMAFILKSDFCGIVDHLNGNRSDNRASNLAVSSHVKNARNKARHRSKEAGIVWYKRYGKWRSQIWLNGKNKFLGYFDDKSDAVEARRVAEKKYWGDR